MERKQKLRPEEARLMENIEAGERELNELFRRVGVEICRAYRDNPQPEVAELMEQVNGRLHQVARWMAELNALRKAPRCPVCGAPVRDEDTLCPACGCRLKDEPPKVRFCDDCGAPLAEGALFCVACGHRIRR